MRRVFSLFPVLILAALFALVACGSASTSVTGTAATVKKAATTNCLTTTSGTIRSVSSGSLSLANIQGRNVKVALTSATKYIRQATLSLSGLKVGMPVTAIAVLNANGTYSALSLSVRSSPTPQGTFTNGAGLCTGQFPGRSGTPGAFGGRGFGGGTPGASGSGGQSRQTVTGTVSQITGNTLIVTDTSGNQLSLTLTATTRVTTQETASVGALRSGVAVTVIGTMNSSGTISANSVSILQGLPSRRLSATPTATP